MSSEISDQQLRQLLSGQLSLAEEQRLENLISLDVSLRARLDLLSGGDQWSIGSAPVPPSLTSARLSLAMQSIEHFIQSGLATENPDPSNSPPAPLPQLNGIQCVRLIGQGGMGVVYEGIDQTLGRTVAVKLIQPMKAASPEARERLLREAKAAASLQHDHIVTIHSVQSLDSTPALIQQYIDGYSLQELLDKEGHLPIERCIDLFKQLASGLAAAHAQGIIHRDIKPGNILIEHRTGKARLADFGMAKHLAELRTSEIGIVAGTPAFMSPEQTRGQAADQRSDLFSLGGVLYNCLTGQAPYDADDPFVVMDRVRNLTAPSVKELRPETPDWLASIIRRLMAKEPRQRIQSADELLQLLDMSSNSQSGQQRNTKITVGRALSIALLTLLVSVAGWLIYQQLVPSSTDLSQSETPATLLPGSPSGASSSTTSKAAVTNERTGDVYLDLVSAVNAAQANDVLIVASDIESNQIDIAAKALVIKAADGLRPTIRASQWAVKHCPFFVRTDSNLRLEGLNIDWPVESPPPFESLQAISGVIGLTSFDRQLQLIDCRIYRSDVGICVAGTGALKMERTWLVGGLAGVVWAARDKPLELEDCILNCANQIVFLFPPIADSPSQPTPIRLSRCSFIGESLMGFIITRRPSQGVHTLASNCTFDVKRAMQINAWPQFLGNLTIPRVAQGALADCLLWQESDCIHASDMEYLVSRRVKASKVWLDGGLKGLDAWSTFWKSSKDGRSKIESASAKRITSQLPARDAEWVFDPEAIHRFE